MERGVMQFSSQKIEFAGTSETGLVRSSNEDSFGLLPEHGVIIVADGMGGYNAGEIASSVAVDTISNYLRQHLTNETPLDRCIDEIERAIEAANLAIAEAVRAAPKERHGMGTTVVAGIFRQRGLGFAWVGDSRLYLLRNQRLVQLTLDHTLVQELVNQHLFPSVEAAVMAGVGENVLTRALGAEGQLLIDVHNIEIGKGDVLLFCSDGLNHMSDRRSIEKVLNTYKISLETKVERLIQLACNAGGRDNITVVLAEVVS